jgi:hypothetical protein
MAILSRRRSCCLNVFILALLVWSILLLYNVGSLRRTLRVLDNDALKGPLLDWLEPTEKPEDKLFQDVPQKIEGPKVANKR